MRSNQSIDDEVSREQIDIKLKSLTNTLQELKKGINIDESPRNTHEDSDYKSMSNTLYSDINHSNLNTKVNLSEYIQSANRNQPNNTHKDDYSADYQDLKIKSAVELIYIIQTEKNRNREAHQQIKDAEYENNALNKRIIELNNEVNELEKLSNQQNNEQINALVNRLNESEKEMSRCHNNLIEQDDIIKRLQNENNNLKDELRKAENDINELKKFKNEKNDQEIENNDNSKFRQEIQKLKKSQDNLLSEFDNKNQIMAELKQSEIDNIEIIQNLSKELENSKNIIKRNEDRLNSKDEEIMHYKKIVIEMNSNLNSKDNSFVNYNNVNYQISNNDEKNNLQKEINERDNQIQKLNDEINNLKNKIDCGQNGNKTYNTPKTSRINQDPNNSKSKNNKKITPYPPKSERYEVKPNPAYNATREMIKKDKMKSEFIKKDDFTSDDINQLNFLQESLCRIFNTKIHSEIIEKAENLQNQVDLNSDYVKFYHKTRDLMQASIPEDLTRRDDGSVRMIFKLIVKIVDNQADMKNSIKLLKQQVDVVDTMNAKDASLADHFSNLLEANKQSNQSIIDDMKNTIYKIKQNKDDFN